LLALVLFAPAAAVAGPIQECRYLSQQIDFFSARLNRAQAVGDTLWQSRYAGHLTELVNERARTCPGFSPGAQAQAAFLELLKLGGQAALTFFTFGMM
jgi:hypothetical protein